MAGGSFLPITPLRFLGDYHQKQTQIFLTMKKRLHLHRFLSKVSRVVGIFCLSLFSFPILAQQQRVIWTENFEKPSDLSIHKSNSGNTKPFRTNEPPFTVNVTNSPKSKSDNYY